MIDVDNYSGDGFEFGIGQGDGYGDGMYGDTSGCGTGHGSGTKLGDGYSYYTGFGCVEQRNDYGVRKFARVLVPDAPEGQTMTNLRAFFN